ncbi:RteC domain-containing protein [Filimonas zeae]|nr:RteC domain-containing protein [Filimonas zeae]
MELLRTNITEQPFKSEQEEIVFFKEVKPVFCSLMMYHVKCYRMESRKPAGSMEAKLKFLHAELQEIDTFFASHLAFFEYYRSGSTAMDDKYFIRGRQDEHYSMEVQYLCSDLSFSTGYDLLIARLLANELLAADINEAIYNLQNNTTKEEKTGNVLHAAFQKGKGYVQTSYRAKELYVFLRSLVDAEGVINHTYKSFFELIVPGIANKQSHAFSPTSLLKYSDKVDMETRDNVKRLLQKMIRNIENY